MNHFRTLKTILQTNGQSYVWSNSIILADEIDNIITISEDTQFRRTNRAKNLNRSYFPLLAGFVGVSERLDIEEGQFECLEKTEKVTEFHQYLSAIEIILKRGIHFKYGTCKNMPQKVCIRVKTYKKVVLMTTFL